MYTIVLFENLQTTKKMIANIFLVVTILVFFSHKFVLSKTC